MNLIIPIGNREFIFLSQQIAAVPISCLGEEAANGENQRHDILKAIDFLITGY